MVGLIAATGIAMRWGFVSTGAPTFVTPDSESYVLPGWELAHGAGFNPELRRTPVYSLFIALVFRLTGDDLERLAMAQHGLGVLTALAAWAAARATYGQLGGLLAGLGVAVSGPLLIYEHYLLSEALFTFLLTGGLAALVVATHRSNGWAFALGGVLLGLAAMCRPIGQLVLPIAVVFALVSAGRAPGKGIRRAAIVLASAMLIVLPWMVRNLVIHHAFATEGALGQALIGRTIRHDRGFVYENPAHPDPDPLRAAARRIIAEEAATGEPSGGRITARVRDELGLSQSETSSLLRGLALEAIWNQRDRYVQSTLDGARELYEGKIERLLGHWRQRTTRNWDQKWDPRIAPMVDNELPADGPVFRQADYLANLAQPFRHRRTITLAIAIGTVLAVLVGRWRPALLLLVTAAAMILASAALDGPVYRYRYPVDPALTVLAAGGVAGPLALLWSALGRQFIGRRT